VGGGAGCEEGGRPGEGPTLRNKTTAMKDLLSRVYTMRFGRLIV
jgi:hypothetical protein